MPLSLPAVFSAALLLLVFFGSFKQRENVQIFNSSKASLFDQIYIYNHIPLLLFKKRHQVKKYTCKLSDQHLNAMFSLTMVRLRGLTSFVGVHSIWSTPVELISIR